MSVADPIVLVGCSSVFVLMLSSLTTIGCLSLMCHVTSDVLSVVSKVVGKVLGGISNDVPPIAAVCGSWTHYELSGVEAEGSWANTLANSCIDGMLAWGNVRAFV